MKKHTLTGMFVLVLFAGALTMAGCGSSASSTGSSPAALTTFSEDVAECTPQLASSEALTEDVTGEDVMTIAHWTGWDPGAQYSIFYNLLTPDCVEGMFDPIDKADMLVNVLNDLRDYWQADGMHNNLTLTIQIATTTATLNADMTVDNTVKTVTVPFFGGTKSVDRLIVLDGTIDDGHGAGPFYAEIAFSTSATGEMMVVRTVFSDKGETSMFYGSKDSGVLDAWAACYVDHGNGDFMDMALKWHGNPAQKVFALTQHKYSNNGDTQILAGGHADGKMAFLAKCTGDAFDSTNPYYLVCTAANLNGTAVPDTDIHIGTGLSSDTSNAVLDYIRDGNASCLGFLDDNPQYPTSASQIPSMR